MVKILGLAALILAITSRAGAAASSPVDFDQGADARAILEQARSTPAPARLESWQLAVIELQDDLAAMARGFQEKDPFVHFLPGYWSNVRRAWPHHEKVIAGFERLVAALDKKYDSDRPFIAAIKDDAVGVKALAVAHGGATPDAYLAALDRRLAEIGRN